MAVVIPSRVDTPKTTTVTWAGVTTADTGQAVDVREFEDPKTIHVVGGGTAQIRRSNDGTNFVAWGSALAANSVNDQAFTAVNFLDISVVATATVTVILTAKKRRV